jgi:hypothetical protein
VDAVAAVLLFGLVVVGLVVWLLRLGSKTADASFAASVRDELSDPQLPALELRRIAYLTRLTAADLHDEVAQHPNAYDGLREWIAAFQQLRTGDRATLDAVHDFPEPPLP